MADVINSKVPSDRRYSRPYAVTPSDTVTDKNLQRNGVPYKYLENCGAGGMAMIAWFPDGALMDIYIGQGQVFELGLVMHLKTTGTTAAGPFRGFSGIDGGTVR